MADLTKPAPKTPAQVRKWREGASYRCTLSKSPGYRVGRVYVCTKGDGGLQLTGDDGFADPVGMLVSGFVEKGVDAGLRAV